MTEQEWLVCADATKMLQKLRKSTVSSKRGRRRLRLFACGICRLLSHLATDDESRNSLEVAEKFADGRATAKELKKANTAAKRAHQRANAACAPRFAKAPPHITRPNYHLTLAISEATSQADIFQRASAALGRLGGAARYSVVSNEGESIGQYYVRADAERDAMLQRLAGVLREIFGNPFRAVTIEPAWRTPTVTSLAQAIYDERAFDRMPVLADALEDAGCTQADVLQHCRLPAEHVRGCWLVDLLLEKE